jgi:predicted amidohydrolase YtcJ
LLIPHTAAGEEGPMAELVLTGGRVVTMDERQPRAEAIALAGDRIQAVGSVRDIERHIGARTRVIELHDELVIPGFIESHGHFMSLGDSRMTLDLSSADSWEQCVTLVAEAAKKTPSGRWVVGNGWHQGKWSRAPRPSVEGYPTHAALSAVTPNNPVLLNHGTGHMVVANARAMELARVERRADSTGGEALRDAAGQLTGVFRENAADLIQAAYDRSLQGRSAAEVQQDRLTAARLAVQECLANGVTSFQDAGSSFATVELYRELARRGELQVRLWVMLNESNEALERDLARYRTIGEADQHLTVRAVKRLIDGAIGTHGAWLLEPYNDLPGKSGLNTTSVESIRRSAEIALKHDCQLCVHAIGDRANRVVLDLFAEATRSRQRDALRWRIEHAQHLNPDDIPRFAQLGVIASMQGVHATSDGPFVVARLGTERARLGAYAWRSLLDHGARIANGTDVPVEPIRPIDCFAASVTRRMRNGERFFPEQCMTREEALRSYTRDAAYAAFEEDLKGSLAPGKLADLVVLSKDILSIPDDEIRTAEVTCTIIGGKIVWQRQP